MRDRVVTDGRDPTLGATDPDRRWTLTNVSEATPEVLSPLCWSVWIPNTEMATRAAWADFGILPRHQVRLPSDPNQFVISAFFGRQALNVDRVCRLMGSLPGTTPEDVERDLFGEVRSGGPPAPRSSRRLPVIAVKATVAAVTQRALVRRLQQEQRAWWGAEVLTDPATPDARARLAEASDRFQRAMRIHARARFFFQALQAQVRAVARSAGAPELEHRLFSGFGQVAETQVADDMWMLSRGGLSLGEFIDRHGFHGTNEGNVIGTSWRQDPAPVEALAKAMAARTDSDRPRSREQAAMADRAAAEAALLESLPRARRPGARLTLRLAASSVRHQEVTKACFLMAIDGSRAAAEALGAQLAGAGTLDDAGDAVYLTVPELVDGPPPDARQLCAFRRQRRDEYCRMVLPVNFTGMPQPVVTTPAPAVGAGPLTGAPGSPGVVEGTARVALHPEEAVLLQPGEILVCRITDPSWAAVMVLARGLVIDIGGPASHGAIVARELGVPCVIGTGDGTARIRTGDHLRVDGEAGTVDVVRPASP